MSSEHSSPRSTHDSTLIADIEAYSTRWSGVEIAQYKIERCARLGKHHALLEARPLDLSVHTQFDRVAIKIPLRHSNGARLVRERLVLEELEGTLLVPDYVLHGRCQEGRPLLAMEWIKGTSLTQRLRLSSALSKHDYFDTMLQLAHGIQEIHARGYAIGNLQGSNVMLDRGRVRVLDLGDAAHVREPQGMRPFDPRRSDIASFGELLHLALGVQGHRDAQFFCGSSVPERLFTLVRRCTQLTMSDRPDIIEIGRILKQLLEQGDLDGAAGRTTGREHSLEEPTPFERDATKLNMHLPNESVELLRQTHEEPTRPRVERPPVLDATARQRLRKRFAHHLKKVQEENEPS